MTIDEAIDFAEDINATVTFPSESKLDEEFFANIPDWLEELKTLRYCKDKWNENQYKQGWADAIDECIDKFAEIMSNMHQICGRSCPVDCNWGTTTNCKVECKKWLRKQLKESKDD